MIIILDEYLFIKIFYILMTYIVRRLYLIMGYCMVMWLLHLVRKADSICLPSSVHSLSLVGSCLMWLTSSCLMLLACTCLMLLVWTVCLELDLPLYDASARGQTNDRFSCFGHNIIVEIICRDCAWNLFISNIMIVNILIFFLLAFF